MTPFSPAEAAASRALVDLALREDLGTAGDLTTRAFIPPDWMGRAAFAARAAGVLAGLPAAEMVMSAVDPKLDFRPLVPNGTRLKRGDRLAVVSGSMRSILIGERSALNFLQRLSGVATLTRRYVDAVAGLPVAVLDTRKTTPGWRLLEKYAVRMGGGQNHRVGLYDGILIKDNHLAALDSTRRAGAAGSVVAVAVAAARAAAGPGIPVEVEVDTLEQFDQALACGPDIVLLDNMNLERMRECVRRRNATAPVVKLEASGGVTLETIRGIAETGVDRISVGALTHSAPALDIALDYD